MKNFRYILTFLSLALIFSACEEETYEFGDITAPSNLQITAEIVGQDVNPTGDGSGVVHLNVTADNAITYKFIYNGSEKTSASGEMTYSFGTTGTETYTITVVAFGTAGVSSSESIQLDVLVVYEPPADLLTMLTGDSSRTWRIKAEAQGHFGVGPGDGFEPIWWSAAPNEKEDSGAYDDRFEFNVDGTFTHTTNGDTFGKLTAMAADLGGDQGLVGDSNDEAVYALDNYEENWSLSTPDGQETLTFSNIGYHGFYVGGDHSYMIQARSENEMSLRTIGADGNAWYAKLIAVD